MQQTEEGEFYPEKFNYNYKIPKRKEGESQMNTNTSIPPPPPPPSTPYAAAAAVVAATYAAPTPYTANSAYVAPSTAPPPGYAVAKAAYVPVTYNAQGYQQGGQNERNQNYQQGAQNQRNQSNTTAYPTNYQQRSGYGQQQGGMKDKQTESNYSQGYQGYQNRNQGYQGNRQGQYYGGNHGGNQGKYQGGGQGKFQGSGGFQRNNQSGGKAKSYYDNYSYDPNAASAYYGQDYSGGYGGNWVNSAQPPVDDGDPIKRNIFKALSGMQEKPKNKRSFGKQIFQSTVPDVIDETLPKDLKLMFQPLFCKLCSAQLSSNAQAKLHYKSKNHEKKIKKWLLEYSEKTGEPLHPRAQAPAANSTKSKDQEAEKAANPSWFHCDICDLDLTGKMHAESHYMGKNHQKVLMGNGKPAGSGHYDANGKWVRNKGQKSSSFDFENGEDNFGSAFREKPDDSSGAPPAKKKKKEPVDSNQFHCDVCDVFATCQDQLDTHYRGSKHAKKLKALGLTNYTAQRELIDGLFKSADTLTDLGLPNDSSVASANEAPIVDLVKTAIIKTTPIPTSASAPGDIDLKSYRTPSGDYYCPTCNSTTNSEIPFLQHMKSKNHAKKMAASKK